MINITIKTDNYAYLTTNSDKMMELLKKSFTREVKEYNQYYKMWETHQVLFYKLYSRDYGMELVVKAGLIPYLIRALKNRRINYVVNNERKSISGCFTDEDIVTVLNDEVTLRNDQIQAVKSGLKTGYGIIQAPTGAGKSVISASIIKTYLKKFPEDTFMYVVPTDMLRKEAKEAFESYEITVNTKLPVVEGAVNIFTYALLSRSDNTNFGYKERDKITAIIWDEAHRLAAPKAQKHIHNFKQIKMSLGMTATPSKDNGQKFFLRDLNADDMAVMGNTGRILYSMEINETIKQKFVTGIEVHYTRYYNNHVLFEDESDWNVVKSVILKDKDRARHTAEYIKWFFDKHNLHTALCYIPEIEWSHIYMTEVAKFFEGTDVRVLELYGGGRVAEHKNGELVNLTKSEAEQAIKDIKDKKVKTVFSGTSFIREGINIKNIQALFNVGGNKGTILIKQLVGRAMRNFENKGLAYICEIEDNNPILRSQWNKKIDLYTREYDAKIIYDDFRDKDPQ